MQHFIKLLRNPYAISIILSILLAVQIFQNRTIIAQQNDRSQTDQSQTDEDISPSIIGKTLEYTQLMDINGDIINIDNESEQMVILFTTTCEYCKSDVELWNTIADINPDKNIYAVTSEKDIAAIKIYVDKYKLKIPVYIDSDHLFTDQFDLKVTPTKIYVDSAMQPLYVWYGQTTHRGGDGDLGAMLAFFNVSPETVPVDHIPVE